MSTQIIFEDEAAAIQALKDVRADSVPTDWVAYEYITGTQNKLKITGTGEGGMEELSNVLDESKRMYAFLRVVDFIDRHQTVKFVFIVWSGERVSVVQKARMATHKGSIQTFIGPAHLTIDASERSDLDQIMGRVADASGSGSRVLSVGEAPRGAPIQSTATKQAPSAEAPVREAPVASAEPVSTPVATSVASSTPARSAAPARSSGPSVSRSSGKLSFQDVDGLRGALADVRSDASPNDWVLFGYEGQTDVVKLVGTGSGGLDELISHLTLDSVAYGLFRTTDIYDGHAKVKFVLIYWIGEEVRLARKARIATHKGELQELIGQHHTDLQASNFDEINADIIKQRVQFASGTASHIKQ